MRRRYQAKHHAKEFMMIQYTNCYQVFHIVIIIITITSVIIFIIFMIVIVSLL